MAKVKKKFKKALTAYINEEYSRGWNEGYDVAAGGCLPEEGESFEDGVRAERERIQAICQMQMRWAEEKNQGNVYMQWKNMSEIIIPIEVDYSEEAYQRNLEADGF